MSRTASRRTSETMAPSKVHLLAILLLAVLWGVGGSRSSRVLEPQSQLMEALARPVVRGSLLEQLSDALPATNASCQCRRQVLNAVRAAQRGHLWALKLVDSSARLPSGLLNGNVNQLGDFDECLAVQQDAGDEAPGSTGKGSPEAACPAAAGASSSASYCLASVSLDVDDAKVSDGRVHLVRQLLYSRTPFSSNFTDPGHRVPRFSAVQIGVCLPSACDAAVLQDALEVVFNSALGGHDGVVFRASVPAGMCRTRERTEPEDGVGAWLARNAFWTAVTVVAMATFLDFVCLEFEGPAGLMRVVHCLSARRNWTRLWSTSGGSPDDVACLHGVRGLNALGLLLAHKSVALLYRPYVNRTAGVAVLGMSWSIVGRVAILYTDCFILLSGVLAALSLLRQLDRTGTVPLVRRVVDRYVRLTPTLAGLIVFCTLMLPGLGSGPMWSLVVEPHAALCRQHWWRNMLYVHNYYGFEDMCLTHTHQLGIDMQLFIVAPLLVYPLWRWPRPGAVLLVVLAALSTALRYHVVLHNELSTIVYFGMSVSQMFRTASLSYILPTHRLTVYIMGLLLGYALHRVPKDFTFSTSTATLGWLVLAPLGLLPVLGPYEAGTPLFRYDVQDAALYAAFAPVLWTGFVCWGVLACARGSGGLLGDFISWRGWVVFTRVAFALYLTQFPVFFYNVGSTRHADFYNVLHLLNISEFAVIMAASVVLCLTFEMPFQELWKELTAKKHDSGEKSKESSKLNPKKVEKEVSIAKRKSA